MFYQIRYFDYINIYIDIYIYNKPISLVWNYKLDDVSTGATDTEGLVVNATNVAFISNFGYIPIYCWRIFQDEYVQGHCFRSINEILHPFLS